MTPEKKTRIKELRQQAGETERKQMTTQETNHAIENATGWYQSIVEMLENLDKPDYKEDAQQEIQESVLSVEVRSDWHVPGKGEDKPTEYLILLTTGGPSLRITGDLNQYQEPETAKLQWQDWGTPWNTIWEDVEEDVLLRFAQQFCFGS